jgi:hypothetical protein
MESQSVGVGRIDLASVMGISEALQLYRAEHPNDSRCAEAGSPACWRRDAHEEGKVHSALNGRQPLFALLGYEDIRSLEGRLLTIVDASFTDREQRKAAKDLVRNAIWFDWVANLDMDGNGGKPDLKA